MIFRDVPSREGGGAYREILLNRPRALNALNINMARLAFSHLKSAAVDPSVAMVIMEGRYTACGGGDNYGEFVSLQGLGRRLFVQEVTSEQLLRQGRRGCRWHRTSSGKNTT